MKLIISFCRFISLSSVLLTFMHIAVYSQGTDSRSTSVKKDKLYIGISFNGLSTNISNEKTFSSSPLVNKKGNSFSASLDLGYFFSRIAGINIGIGYGSYVSEFSIDTLSVKYQTTDSENENYEMQIIGKSIIENQKISFLSFPVCLNIRFPVSEILGFFLKGGINIDIPITKTYNGSGTFTYNGYYPEYPVLLHNLPEYGFPSNLETKSSGELKINSINTTLIASGGVYISLSKRLKLLLGAHLSKSLSNVSAYKQNPSYRITSKANELNSIMEGSSKANLQAVGVNLGINYYFR
jgi:hypothetical protein